MQQHQNNCNSKLKTQNDKTMLSKRAISMKHTFDFKNPIILHKEPDKFKRNLVESIYIAKNLDKVVNERKDAGNINLFYSNIITKL